MKKYFIRTIGFTILIMCALSAGISTLFTVAVVINLIFCRDIQPTDEGYVFYCILTFPMLCYFWYMWCDNYWVDKLRGLLYWGEKEK